MSGLKIPKKKEMSIKNNLVIYNKPEKVYIPLVSGGDTNLTLLVKKDDYVFKGSIVGRRKSNFKTPVFSSVSGTVIGFEDRTFFNGEKVKCVVIENDFKEKIKSGLKIDNDMNSLSKDSFLNILEEKGIIGLGGAGFPTYVKYSGDNKINTLIINAIECEPYITCDYQIICDKCEEILETIDAIMEINKIDEAIIAIKKSNASLNAVFDKYIGTYLKIKVKMVDNIYPMGWERKLIHDVKGIEYGRLPSEKGIVVNNVSTIYAIYQALKQNKPLIERIVTFSGEGLNNPTNVLVKIGTPIKEVIDFIGGTKKGMKTGIVVGGPMMGELTNDNLVISAEMNCVLVLEDNLNLDVKTCLRCSKCVMVCPAKISPVLIKDSINNRSKLEELGVNRCISCGLCSYVCPAKINVREFVRQAKDILKEGK